MPNKTAKLSMRRFKMDWIGDSTVVVFIGRRGTGKSWLIRDLMYHKQHFALGKVICATEGFNAFYSDFIPKAFISTDYESKVLGHIFKRQKKLMRRIRKGESDIDPKFFLLMDDCLYDDSWARDKLMRGVFMNGRHAHIFFILAMQYAIGIPPNLRTNIDYTFILKETNIENRKKLYVHYAGVFPTFELFCKILDQCTTNHECLVIYNGADDNSLANSVFFYKAKKRPDFRVGAQEFWDVNDQYESDTEDEFDEQDYNESFRPKSKQFDIRVNRLEQDEDEFNMGYNGNF